MFNFFKRKNSKKNKTISIDNSNDSPAPERDEKISMVQCNKEKSKPANHVVQQVPSNKCSQNTNPSRINDREPKTSPPDEVIIDKNNTIHSERVERNSYSGRCNGVTNNVENINIVGKKLQSYPKISVGGVSDVLLRRNSDIGQENILDNNKREEKFAESADRRINGIQTLSFGVDCNSLKNQHENKNINKGKEVINLLLPEKDYKKNNSISKTTVQSFLDIMGGGKKKKNKLNKSKQNEICNRKSWSFNGNKLKSDVFNEDCVDRSAPENYKLQKNELQRSMSVPSANTCPKLFEVQNNSACIPKSNDSKKDAYFNYDNVKQTPLPMDCFANKSLEPTITKEIESTIGQNNTCQNKNKKESPQETPAMQRSDVVVSGEKEGASDDLRTDVTSVFIGNSAKTVGSRPDHCEDSVHANSISSKCDTGQTCNDGSADFVKSLLLEKYNNKRTHNLKNKTRDDLNYQCTLNEHSNSTNTESEEHIDSSLNNNSLSIKTKQLTVDSENHPTMGSSESRQSGGRESGNIVDKPLLKDENITGNFDYVVKECGRFQGEAVDVTQGEKTVTVIPQADVNVFNENIYPKPPDNSLREGRTETRENESAMEEADCKSSDELDNNEGEVTRLKNILKDVGEFDSKSAAKKHVTFHKIINFDDGDNMEDEDSVSFASLDDEDDNIDFDLNKVENYEVVFPENDENVTRENSGVKSDSCSKAKSNTLESQDVLKMIEKIRNEKNQPSIEIREMSSDDEVENNENLGLEVNEAKPIEKSENEVVVNDAFNKIIEVKEVSESESEEDEEVEEEESESDEEEEETCEESNSECETSDSSVSDDVKKEKVIFDSEKVVEEVKKQEALWEIDTKEDESAYAELLRVVERQLMRGLAGQEGRLADLQERAAALHRVQSEVCSARKEAELIRQKLIHVEGDLAATRTRNSQLVEQFEARAEEIRLAERKADELAEEVVRLQQKLDQIQPDIDELKGLNSKLKKEREHDKKAFEEAIAREQQLRQEREKSWKAEFEKLRSQSAENEELLLADCEWKLRDVQKSASERCAKAEGKLAELQKNADAKCAIAEKQIYDLRIEISSLRASSLEHQRTIRQNTQQVGALEAAKIALEQESKRLKTLLNMELDKTETLKAQHVKELDEKDKRMMVRLAEEAKKAEIQGRMSKRAEECSEHDKALREANKKIQELKETLSKKEAQFAERLEKAETRADWQIMEIRRSLDKAELKYSEALEKLQDQYALDTERITAESEKRIKELENTLSAQTCSSRATLELVRERLQAEHTDNIMKLKEQHRIDMENQWELFTHDKEQCLERMKSECMMESEEEREKRDKQLLKDIVELKQELEIKGKDVDSLRIQSIKANEARASAERKLSEAQAALLAKELAVRSEVARQAEVEKKEARDTIEHLTKKCACLTNLFEDMRSRWQQAPGEAAQLRKALQDEKARAQALRRQLDALSRDLGVGAENLKTGGGECSRLAEDGSNAGQHEGVKKRIVEKNGNIHTIMKPSKKVECDYSGEGMKKDRRIDKNNTLIMGNSTTYETVTEKIQELDNIWTLVKKGGLRKRTKRVILSPPKNVDLPAVTVPVRIRQFDANRKK